jgi:non-specific serine/threonine protein kinase
MAVGDPDGADCGDAVELFATRAVAVLEGFALSPENAGAVATLCRQLDGVPLAIELAAALLPVLSVEQITGWLDDRFALLTGGDRHAPLRHQTLRTAIGWSHELCEPSERLLWARLSVFSGDFDLDAVKAICTDRDRLTTTQVSDLVGRLVDKSILLAEAHPCELRYRMLDTVREFGRDWLQSLGEQDALAHRHRDHYLELAERFDADWFGPRQVQWAQRMRAEYTNLRQALGFCLDRPGEARTGVRLAGTLYYFWFGCGEVSQGRYWLERALAVDPHRGRERVRALAAYCRILNLQGAPVAACDPSLECVELARRYDDQFSLSEALQVLGISRLYGGDLDGLNLLEQAVSEAGRLGEAHHAVALAKMTLALGVLLQGDPVRAQQLCAESRAIFRDHGDQYWLSRTLNVSIMPAMMSGELVQAEAYGRECLEIRRALQDPWGVATALECMAWTAAAAGDHRRAARLLGVVDRMWRDAGGSPFSAGPLLHVHQQCETSTLKALGQTAFEREFSHGAQLTADQAVAYTLDLAPDPA